MNIRKICLTVIAVSLVGACASYEPTSAPVAPKTAFSLVEAEGVAAGAFPYAKPEEYEPMFDADLDKSDVIAVHVMVENRRPSAVLVRPSDMSLVLADGRVISPSNSLKVANKVGEDGSVIGSAIAFGLIGLIVASNAEEKARAARIDDYVSKSLDTADLRPGDSADGVVFFIPPKSWPAFDEAELSVSAIDKVEGTSDVVSVQLTGLNYVPGKPEE
jgi:hypothetical protein